MQTVIDKQHKWLLGRFHAACSKLGMSVEEKKEVIYAYGCESSADINNEDLLELCFKLEKQHDPVLAEMDLWRKRVFGAIGCYLKFIDKQQTVELIKAVATRATGFDNFNEIPVDRLRNVYYAFVKKQKDFERSWKEMEKLLHE